MHLRNPLDKETVEGNEQGSRESVDDSVGDSSAWARLAADAVPLRARAEDHEDSERGERIRLFAGKKRVGWRGPPLAVMAAAVGAVAIVAAILPVSNHADIRHGERAQAPSRLEGKAIATRRRANAPAPPSPRRRDTKRHRRKRRAGSSTHFRNPATGRRSKSPPEPSASPAEESTASSTSAVPTSTPVPEASPPSAPSSNPAPSAATQAEREFSFER